jgi:hypothetical protein
MKRPVSGPGGMVVCRRGPKAVEIEAREDRMRPGRFRMRRRPRQRELTVGARLQKSMVLHWIGQHPPPPVGCQSRRPGSGADRCRLSKSRAAAESRQPGSAGRGKRGTRIRAAGWEIPIPNGDDDDRRPDPEAGHFFLPGFGVRLRLRDQSLTEAARDPWNRSWRRAIDCRGGACFRDGR